MTTVLWSDFIHEPLFQQTIRDVIEPRIVADRVAPLEARILKLEDALNDLQKRLAKDDRAEPLAEEPPVPNRHEHIEVPRFGAV